MSGRDAQDGAANDDYTWSTGETVLLGVVGVCLLMLLIMLVTV